jgi:hypothetical protein
VIFEHLFIYVQPIPVLPGIDNFHENLFPLIIGKA